MNILKLIGRNKALFKEDLELNHKALNEEISKSSFLIIGAAGSIGRAVTKEVFKRSPKKIHLVDISENNLVELVRDIRSSFGYIKGEFKTFALDVGSDIYDDFFEADGKYDYILNLSALKHVRSEKDPYTLMRMIDVNIFNTDKTIQQAIAKSAKKYFCVSTDKATNPVNMMGASKRIMEMFLMRRSKDISISTARFANVAFSDGSLLHGFNQRIQKKQPIVAPNDIKRYFITPQESGELCLMSTIFGDNRDVFFPKLNDNLHLTKFSDIALRYLESIGKTVVFCETEDEARAKMLELDLNKYWACLFTKSDTTGEKDFEEFFTEKETLDLNRFRDFGIIKNDLKIEANKIKKFEDSIQEMRTKGQWKKSAIVDLFNKIIPNFNHKETGKYLDEKM